MVHDIITNAAHYCTPELAHTPGTCNYKRGFGFLCKVYDSLTRLHIPFQSNSFELTVNLKTNNNTNLIR